jgi:acetoin utilization deacetylase AcuC-like enzyme
MPPQAAPAIAVFYHPVFLEHDTGEHPENRRRLEVARQALDKSALDLEWVMPEPASASAIARVHDAAYVQSIRRLAAEGGGWLDWDTAVSPKSFEAATRAAGAGIAAVDRALTGEQKAFMLVRPPGHHACAARGMGFCLFNNIAVAAAHALEERGLERVLIVDWDVHHGNGTQEIFYDDPRVLFFSLHEFPHYPGTGSTREVGAGTGAGYTVNVPLQAGASDGAVLEAFESLLAPLARAFAPQLLLVSAGYDSQSGDPLGDLRFSRVAFQWMAARLLGMAQELGAAGPLCFLEGGYAPDLLASSIVATLTGLSGELPPFQPFVTEGDRADIRGALEAIRPWWKEAL